MNIQNLRAQGITPNITNELNPIFRTLAAVKRDVVADSAPYIAIKMPTPNMRQLVHMYTFCNIG